VTLCPVALCCYLDITLVSVQGFSLYIAFACCCCGSSLNLGVAIE
jgi:hypothetical protein